MANKCSNTIFKPYPKPRLARYAASSSCGLKEHQRPEQPSAGTCAWDTRNQARSST
jgi:hypothetical protein